MKPESLSERTEKEFQRLLALRKLLHLFPDLDEYTDRWNRKYLVHKDCLIPTHVHLSFGCGCCPDSFLLVYPYTEIKITLGLEVDPKTEVFHIYRPEISYPVGNNNDGNGVMPLPNWEKILQEKNIPQSLIKVVDEYMKDRTPDPEYPEDDTE